LGGRRPGAAGKNVERTDRSAVHVTNLPLTGINVERAGRTPAHV